MRPIKTHDVFDLALDTLICVWGGLLTPRLCRDAVERSLAPYDSLVSLESQVSTEDSHLSKAAYLAIVSSDERTRLVGNHACCMVALFAFESLKANAVYEQLKDHPSVVFLRHLRNASAHGNRFHFYRDSARQKFVDPGKVIWRDKTISGVLQDEPAFPDFFSSGDFAYLLSDISTLMR
jgi:hypothetical protein